MIFNEYVDREQMVIELAQIIAVALTDMLGHAPRASLAVAGGTTPGPVFDILCGVNLDWSRVDILLTDERWVAEDSPRSNTKLLRDRLLVDHAAKANLIPLYGGTELPEESLGMLGDGVRAALPLSVVLLGMGEDMHTASLFPGADKLEHALSPSAPPLLAMRAPGADEPRVTLTAPVLNGAMSKHLIITGTAKRAAFARAESQPAHIAPIRAIMRGLNVHWAP